MTQDYSKNFYKMNLTIIKVTSFNTQIFQK